jgi:hypothetical protein
VSLPLALFLAEVSEKGMIDFDDLEQKALELATKTADADSMMKAAQALSTIRQLRGYRPAPIWPTAVTSVTALLAIILTAWTVYNQLLESRERSQAAEDAQWTETLKQISLKDSSVQTGIFGLQGFFDSQRHGAHAREVASALLPLADNKDTFEIVLKSLVAHTRAENQRDLTGIAKTIAYSEWDLFHALKTSAVPKDCPVDDIIAFLNFADRCFAYKNGEEDPLAKRAWLYSWEIDSMSDALGKLWQRGSPSISPANLNLAAIILENTDNLKGLDFSNTQFNGAVIHLTDLSGARFGRARLSGIVFHQILRFEGSTWEEANWWDADSLSCGFSAYLAKNYWPDKADRQLRAHQLVANCTSDRQ